MGRRKKVVLSRLDKEVRKAAEAGMSYGKYKAMIYEKQQRLRDKLEKGEANEN